MKNMKKMKKLLVIPVVALLVVAYMTYSSPEPDGQVKSVSDIISVFQAPTPTPTTVLVPVEEVRGLGEINRDGTHTDLELTIPVNGGKVTGTTTGFCETTIEGAFDPRTNFIQGKAKGICAGLPSSGRFEGEILLDEKTGSGIYLGTATVFKQSGVWDVVIE